MIHPLVTQLRFTRSEFKRCLEGVGDEDALRRIEPLNCLSWIVGHLASQEHFLWIENAKGRNISPNLEALVGFRRPASTPGWQEMWKEWRDITREADIFLNTINEKNVSNHVW